MKKLWFFMTLTVSLSGCISNVDTNKDTVPKEEKNKQKEVSLKDSNAKQILIEGNGFKVIFMVQIFFTYVSLTS